MQVLACQRLPHSSPVAPVLLRSCFASRSEVFFSCFYSEAGASENKPSEAHPLDGLIGAKEGSPIYTVYILRSLKAPQRIYIGSTTNLEKRLYAHNHAGSAYTARFAPWELETHLVFKDKTLAKQFASPVTRYSFLWSDHNRA